MFNTRAAVILLGSTVCGAITGALQLAEGTSWPDTLLLAGIASGAAVRLLAFLVKDDSKDDSSAK